MHICMYIYCEDRYIHARKTQTIAIQCPLVRPDYPPNRPVKMLWIFFSKQREYGSHGTELLYTYNYTTETYTFMKKNQQKSFLAICL